MPAVDTDTARRVLADQLGVASPVRDEVGRAGNLRAWRSGESQAMSVELPTESTEACGLTGRFPSLVPVGLGREFVCHFGVLF